MWYIWLGLFFFIPAKVAGSWFFFSFRKHNKVGSTIIDPENNQEFKLNYGSWNLRTPWPLIHCVDNIADQSPWCEATGDTMNETGKWSNNKFCLFLVDGWKIYKLPGDLVHIRSTRVEKKTLSRVKDAYMAVVNDSQHATNILWFIIYI